MIDPNAVKFYADNGFTLLSEAKPPVGVEFKAARVFVERGFGGVMLATRRREVDAVRMVPDRYYDLLNQEEVVLSEIEAWRSTSADSADTSASP
jgi:hypothetical protein